MVIGTISVLPQANEGALPPQEQPATPAGDNVVISEVVNDCIGTEDYEFVELYNPTASDISLVGWDILYESSTFSAWDVEYTIQATDGNGGVIPAYGYYLIGEEDTTTGNDVFTVFGVHVDNLGNPTINLGWGTNCHVGLRDDTGTLVDRVGLGTATNPEAATTPQPATGSSAERKSGLTHVETEGNGQDTDDNSQDFYTRSVPQPQNSSSPPEGGGPDTTPPDLWYAISTSTTTIEARFNETVNQSDVENIDNWKIVSLAGFDTTAPYIVECKATSTTSVEVTFSEPVNSVDANDIKNYETVTGLAITGAVLDSELKTVNLTTDPQTIDQTYTLLVSWINDTASPPNVIDQYSQATFNGGGGSGIMKIVFIDVEQGDATLVISPTGQAMLFDGGDTGTGAHIVNTLNANGVTQLKYTVASHYHEDHIGGMDEVITGLGGISSVTGGSFDRGGSYSSTPYNEYENAVFTKRLTINKGDVLDLGGGVTATCVAVNGNGLNPSNENDKGVVMRIDYQNFQTYLGGDLGGVNNGNYIDVESSVALDTGQVEVYQADHHGSMYSSNSYFLGVIDPLVSIFSVGQNSYGHVHQDAFDRVTAQGSYMYYTNPGNGAIPTAAEGRVVNGDITLTSDGSSFTVDGDNYVCYDQTDTTPPTIIDVRATDLTHVELTFSESINQTDAEIVTNYDIDGGIGPNPSGAVLQADLRTVNLTTATQTEGKTYNITVNNIKDRATTPNTIQADTVVSFTGGRPTLGILSVTIDPNDRSIVYITTDVQSRIGYALYAYNIQDEADTPNIQPETSVSFVGGGGHLTINEILYDATGLDDDNEWWEIYNPEVNPINLKSWKFSDNMYLFGLPPDDMYISNGQYATMAINGLQFYKTYGYYPDFEIYGTTESKDMSYSGSYHSLLGNTGDYIEMSNSRGQIYDAVVWGNEAYGTMTNYTAPDVSAGQSLERVIPGREGPEDVLASSPTGADEQSEKQNSGIFQPATPTPQTLDSLPPDIVDVRWDIGSNFAVVYWNTTETGWPEINPESDTKVVYSTNTNPDLNSQTAYDALRVTEHGIMLYPLDPSTDYYFYIESTDGKGQTARDDNGGTNYRITTADADATAPVISNIQVIPGDTTAQITWDTDELSSSSVYYGVGTPPTDLRTNLYLTTNHSIMLFNLTPSTTYYYSVSSKNPSGLSTLDDNSGGYYSFTTTAPETVNFYTGNMDSFTEYSSGIKKPSRAYDYANGGPGALGTSHLVISEVYFNTPSTDDETITFVELYNPTDTAITFTAGDPWYVTHVNGLDDSIIWTATLDSGTIPSHGFFLIGGSSLSFDIAKPGSLQNGPDSVRLEYPLGTYIDVVGWDGTGTGTAFDGPENYETSPFPTVTEGSSIERLSSSVHNNSAGNQLDNGDNSQDFYEKTVPEPQNSASPIEDPPIGTGPDINVLGINDYAYQLNDTEYTNGKSEEANKTVNGDFVALYGQQLWDGVEGFGQISVYDENVQEIANGSALVNLDDAYQWVVDHQAIGIFNAPGYRGNFENMRYNATADQYMNAIEVLAGYRYFDYEYYYNLGLRNGWHIGALAGQRNEQGNWGNKINAYNKIDLTMFRAPDLTSASIKESLRSMDFYAYEANTLWPPSNDPVVLDPIFMNFSVNGYDMGQKFTDANELIFDVELNATNPFYTVELIEDGDVVMTWSGTPVNNLGWTFTYTPEKGHHYYYIRGNQTDANNSNFWSSPIWVYNPALSLPDSPPDVHSVSHTPISPSSTDDVIITATVEDVENAISVVNLWYSVDGGAYTSLEIFDDGAGADAIAGDGIFTGVITAKPDGTNIHYYVEAVDDSGQYDTSPYYAPADFYSYYVGPHVLINEVYADAYDTYPTAGDEESEFIELYNPTASVVDLQDWTIENLYYPDTWAWPAGATIAANGYLVIARDSMYDAGGGGYRGDSDLTTDQAIPDWEMVDASDVYDDTSSANMILVDGNSEIRFNNAYDGLILSNNLGTQIDAMEYGRDYSYVPGTPAVTAPESCSLTRDTLHTDTDDSYADFSVIGNPTPGVDITLPTINDVQWTPYNPLQGEVVTVTARLLDDTSTPTGTLQYAVNGGAFTAVAMVDDGTGADAVAGDNYFTAQIPGQNENDVVDFYIQAQTGPISSFSPYGAPVEGNYSYVIAPHLLITEVYYNATTDSGTLLSSKFVEIYNPTGTAVNISGYQLQSEPTSWSRQWAFPSGTIMNPGDILVVANNAGDGSNVGFYTEFGILPDFELWDNDTTEGADYDNPTVPNMVQLVYDQYDSHFELGNAPYYDAIYLKHSGGAIIDSMEYGIEGEKVPGETADEAPVGHSLQRDELATDTDNCIVDFTPGLPTPGALPTPPTPYDIAIADPAGPFPAWRFISFPKAMSGPITTVLNDTDGGYEWDIAYWYDPADTNDPWKSYNKNAAALGIPQDMPDVDESMGMWVRITQKNAGSDDILTTGTSGPDPAGGSIVLAAGWNLVGYPSSTPRQADTTLPAEVTKIAVYNGSQSYLIEEVPLSSVTMAEGNAYWVYATAATTWNVGA